MRHKSFQLCSLLCCETEQELRGRGTDTHRHLTNYHLYHPDKLTKTFTFLIHTFIPSRISFAPVHNIYSTYSVSMIMLTIDLWLVWSDLDNSDHFM